MAQQFRQEKKKAKTENKLLNNLANVYEKFMYGQVKSEDEQILENIRIAHEDWKNAEKYFQNVTDPDLIDHAIYRIEAARTRYTYLLKLAREMNVHGDIH
ncbi:YaaL family protein [Wukongibacter sp. M2B1]|uniref:YaaL family protein n=1 Tax=Wukongibacter sp. M2B1 TaxID=3088895 RepID=UPI003D7A984D